MTELPQPALSLMQFARPQRWWLARGVPPALHDLRRWVRALRTTLLLGVMGLASASVSTAFPLISLFLNAIASGREYGEFGLLVWPGLVFGGVVLLPVSRWCGRNWWAAVLAVFVSIGCYYVSVSLYLEWNPLFGNKAFSPEVAGALAGLIGGAGVGLWMLPWRRPRRWWTLMAVAAAGGLGGLLTGAGWRADWNISVPSGLDWLRGLIGLNLCFSPFQGLVAVALGLRLWWDEPPPREVTADDERLPSQDTPLPADAITPL